MPGAKWLTGLALLAILNCFQGPTRAAADAAVFTGSEQCAQCHSELYAAWQGSDHHRAMRPATGANVLGDFNDVTVNFHGITTRLYREGEDFRVTTLGADGKPGDFPVRYTFGHYPLQQYLVDIGAGRLQALNVAWDSRSREQGGQRWYHLQDDERITPEHPFFWTRYFQNANSRCIECHSTDVTKNFDADSDSYSTRWTETGVGCESCHGPASRHLALALGDKLQADDSGFDKKRKIRLRWTFEDNSDIASANGERDDSYLDTCGACHSRRSTNGDLEALAPYHDRNRLALVESGLYFSDGQIDDEVFVLGSFLQSKMQQKGVTCGNCHDPHSGKTIADGNALCAQCHQPKTFDAISHHHHEPGSSGALCVNCHMPERVYMTVDPRRDHSFSIPNPGLALESNRPNACNNCHLGKTPAWAASAIRDWGINVDINRWTAINRGLNLQDALVFQDYLRNPPAGLPALREASLIGKLSAFPSRLAFEHAADRLRSPDPLLRRAAIGALSSAPLELRWPLLNSLIEDPLQTIRHEVAINLADALPQLTGKDAERLERSVEELRSALAYNADSPTGQLAIGNLELRMGYQILAERAFKQALAIEPKFVPALLNLADLYRSLGSDREARTLLERALDVAPDSANTHHAYGLYLVRAGQQDTAIQHLEMATRQPDANPRHVYVYAVALDSRGQTGKAIETIAAASERWPNQLDLYFLQVAYLEKTGNTGDIKRYLSVLARIAPDNAQVRNWITRYK